MDGQAPAMLDPSSDTLDIDILVLPETNLILVASVIEPLRAANRISGQELYRWRIFSPDGEPVETRSRIPVPVDGPFRPEQETAPLFILSSYQWEQSATPALRRQLSQTARYRRMMAGIESGSWLLAQASLLDGHSVTIQLGLASPGPPGRPDIMTMRPTPSSLASRKVFSVTSCCRCPSAPGNSGLPEQLSAEIDTPCAASLAVNSRRAGSLSSIRSRSRCGAGDQFPQPNSTNPIPSSAQAASIASKL